MAREAASAVAFIHDSGLMHRDVKCGNILLSNDLRTLQGSEPSERALAPRRLTRGSRVLAWFEAIAVSPDSTFLRCICRSKGE